MKLTAEALDPREVACDLLVIPVFKGGIAGPGAAQVLEALGLAQTPVTPAFRGDIGQQLRLTGTGIAAGGVLLVGLGRMDAMEPERLRRAAAVAGAAARQVPVIATTLAAVHPTDAVLQAVGEGLLLGAATDLRYRSSAEAEAPRVREAILLVPSGRRSAARLALQRSRLYAKAGLDARRLVNTPPADKAPEQLAASIAELVGDACAVTVHDAAALAEQGCGGILGVGRGSANPPCMVELRYRPASPLGHVALVGKGITFDAGGLSLKTTAQMREMKSDMAGAAAIVGACTVLADLGVRTAVTAFLPLAENLPGADAQRPDDVLRMRDGTTVEVLDTDAEGRLVLADALAAAAALDVDAIVDLATLTGTAVAAVGRYAGALFTQDDQLAGALRLAAEVAGEPLWQLPLWDDLLPFLRSDVADLRNVPDDAVADPGGGAVTAALFLQRFAGEVPWAHLDVAGPVFLDERLAPPWSPVGGTGFGARLLLAWLERRAA